MKLIASLTSPFARKVRILLAEKAVSCTLVVDIPWEDGTRVPDFNPLGKVPVLQLDDGSTLYDSRVIAEYLDMAWQPSFLPAEPLLRVQVRRMEALADGIADAAATIFVEQRRPAAQQSPAWIERQHGKIRAGLQALAVDVGEQDYLTGTGITVADIAAVCTLGYLDLRFPEIDWRADYPALAGLYARLDRRPAVQDTRPPR